MSQNMKKMRNHDNSNQETMKNLQILVSKQGITSKLKSLKFGKKKMLGRRLASHGKYHRDKNEFSELIQPKLEPSVNHSQNIGSLVYRLGIEHYLSAKRSQPPKKINKILLKSPQTYLFRYDKNKTMSLGCETGFACVSLLVQGEQQSGKPGTSRETQANPVSQPSDMVLL